MWGKLDKMCENWQNSTVKLGIIRIRGHMKKEGKLRESQILRNQGEKKYRYTEYVEEA